jgi:hypothetical protein
MLIKTQTEVNRWQIALKKTVLFNLMNTMNFFPQLLCCTCRLHMVPLSLSSDLPSIACLPWEYQLLFWIFFSGENRFTCITVENDWSMRPGCSLQKYMYTVRPSLAVVWSKKNKHVSPLGFFFHKKKMAVKHLLPHLLTAHIFPPCLALLRIFKWKYWVTRAFSIIASTNQIFIQHSIVLLQEWECKLYVSMSFQKYSI